MVSVTGRRADAISRSRSSVVEVGASAKGGVSVTWGPIIAAEPGSNVARASATGANSGPSSRRTRAPWRYACRSSTSRFVAAHDRAPQYAASVRIAAAIFAGESMKASSSGRAFGEAGESGPARRVTGPSR